MHLQKDLWRCSIHPYKKCPTRPWQTNPTTATVPNITAEPLSRGPGLTVGGGNTFNSGNWATGNKLDHNDYIEWSVTADPGYVIHINEFQINFDRDPDGISHFFTGNGPAKIRIRSSLDNFKSDLYANDKISNSGQSPNVETSLTSSPGGTITFRLYGFASNIGMLGDLGTLDIEGGLGEILGLANTGIRLSGKVTYDGLLYSNGSWVPHAPNASTSDKNVLIRNGIYSVSDHIKVNNLIVDAQAGIVIQKTGAITVQGTLTTADNVVLQSDAHTFSSLIVKDSVVGSVTYQRQVVVEPPFGSTGNQILLSAPVSGEPFNVFRAANPKIAHHTKSSYVFGPFDNAKSTYAHYSKNETAKLTPGTGYRVATTSNGTFTFKGTVSTDTIAKKLVRSNGAQAAWNLIGNPYPSYVTLSEFLETNASLFDAEVSGIYDFEGDAANGWRIRNLAYLTMHPDAILAPGEGFMVAAKKEGGEVIFTPNMRTTGEIDSFLVKAPPLMDKLGYFKLQLSTGVKNATTDFYFNAPSTNGFDSGYDAGYFDATVPEFVVYSQLAEQNSKLPLAIQSLPYEALGTNTIIPLGVHAPKGEQLTLRIHEVMLPKETEVYLEDQLTQTFISLNATDYTFYTHTALSGTGRFLLHLVNNSLSYGNSDFDTLQLYTSNGGQTLHVKQTLDSNVQITIFDLQERLIYSTEIDEEDVHKAVDLSALQDGMYLLKAKTGPMEKIQKIVIDTHMYQNIQVPKNQIIKKM